MFGGWLGLGGGGGKVVKEIRPCLRNLNIKHLVLNHFALPFFNWQASYPSATLAVIFKMASLPHFKSIICNNTHQSIYI